MSYYNNPTYYAREEVPKIEDFTKCSEAGPVTSFIVGYITVMILMSIFASFYIPILSNYVNEIDIDIRYRFLIISAIYAFIYGLSMFIRGNMNENIISKK